MHTFLRRWLQESTALGVEGQRQLGQTLVQMHTDYWSPNEPIRERLIAQLDSLDWRSLFRLHQLNCLSRLEQCHAMEPPHHVYDDDGEWIEPEREERRDRELLHVLAKLEATNSPYHGRYGRMISTRGQMYGELINVSMTHLGSLEIIRMSDMHPVCVELVPFTKIQHIEFGPPGLFRMSQIRLIDGTQLGAWVPLLYGASWRSTRAHMQDGAATSFVSHLARSGFAQTSVIGLGHQELQMDHGSGPSLSHLGSIDAIDFSMAA